MAIHAPITGAPTRAIQLPPVLAFIMGLPIAPREAVERTIQAAIDALDELETDPDLEDDEREQEHRRRPHYGINQSLGPVDFSRAYGPSQPTEIGA